jgi:hypothetical protein
MSGDSLSEAPRSKVKRADQRCLVLSFQSARDRERSLTNRQRGVPVMKDLHVTHL